MKALAPVTLTVIYFFLSETVLLAQQGNFAVNLTSSPILLAQQSNSNPPSRGTPINRRSAGPRLLELPDDDFSLRQRSAVIYYRPSINKSPQSRPNSLGGTGTGWDIGSGIVPNNSSQNDLNRESLLIYTQGLQQYKAGKFQEALDSFTQALIIFEKNNLKEDIGGTLTSIGLVYEALNEPLKAIESYQKALSIFQAIKKNEGIFYTLNNLGIVYEKIGDSEKALEYYTQAFNLSKNINDRTKQAIALNNLGIFYQSLQQETLALDYYNQALSIYQNTNAQQEKAFILNQIASVYKKLDAPLKAISYYQKSLNIYQNLKAKTETSRILINLGNQYRKLASVYDDLKNKPSAFREYNQKALDYYNQGITLVREKGDRRPEAITLNNIGIVYLRSGDNVKATEYLRQSLMIFQEIGDSKNVEEIRNILQEIHGEK